MAALRTRANRLSSSVTVPDEAFARTIARIKGMTKQQRIQSLKDAGILTPSGNYTKPYRAIEQKRVA